MAVAIHQVCAHLIQTWYRKRIQLTRERRADGFDAFALPLSWNKENTYDETGSVFFPQNESIITPKLENKEFDNRTKSRTSKSSISSSHSKQASTCTDISLHTDASKFDKDYYNRSHTNFYDEDLCDTFEVEHGEVEASISLLAKVQNGMLGRFVKFFRKKANKRNKKKKKLRIKKLFKKRSIKETQPHDEPSTMLGDPEANANLPDPLSLYHALLEEEDEHGDMDTQQILTMNRIDNVERIKIIPKEESVQFNSHKTARPIEDEDSSSEEDFDRHFTFSDAALVRVLTSESVPFDEI